MAEQIGGGKSDSSELRSAFDAFYQRFILRDVFGKMVPGAIVLLSIFSVWHGSFLSAQSSISVALWIAAAGGCWLAGMAVQSLGELSGFFLAYPRKRNLFYRWMYLPSNAIPWRRTMETLGKNERSEKIEETLSRVHFETDAEFLECYYQCIVQSSSDARRLIERYVVLKEACGNGYIALAIANVLFLCQPVRPHLFILIASWVAVASLFRMHFKTIQRQHLMLAQAIAGIVDQAATSHVSLR